MSTIAPYGSWKSPITPDLIVAESIRLGEPSLNGGAHWLEQRPGEAGRYAIVRHSDTSNQTVTPLPLNVRTRVHEYGGGAYVVDGDSAWFTNFDDQHLFRIVDGGPADQITSEMGLRYADFVVDAQRGLLFSVREDHRGEGEAVNTIATVRSSGDDLGGSVIVSGHDFYSNPRLSPDGKQLTWLAWNHPNMPWDGTELWVGDVNDDGSLSNTQQVAGGLEESVFQPEWSPSNVLHFVSDRTGWWNLYRWQNGEIDALCPKEAEFGVPGWVFRQSTYGFISAETILLTYGWEGKSRLARLNTTTGELSEIETPFTSIGSLVCTNRQAIFLGGTATDSRAVVLLDLATDEFTILKRESDLDIDADYISAAQAIEFPTERGLTAYAYYYPPSNRDFTAPEGETPPLLVLSHGGPTSAVGGTLDLKKQYWTSRGIAVVDVNYGGSTGFGREYRQRLNGNWGIVDSEDCINAAKYLVDQGNADGDRLLIAGGSAGGYTTLCVLTFNNVFAAGASHFGVSDLEALALHTHKFESRYLDSMIGPYPERKDIYVERSPINHVQKIDTPMILFQGLEDLVVPPSQAERMVEAVLYKEIPVAYLAFEGEQHGFRRAENVKRVLEAELYFYSKICGFDLADDIEPVNIENL